MIFDILIQHFQSHQIKIRVLQLLVYFQPIHEETTSQTVPVCKLYLPKETRNRETKDLVKIIRAVRYVHIDDFYSNGYKYQDRNK